MTVGCGFEGQDITEELILQWLRPIVNIILSFLHLFVCLIRIKWSELSFQSWSVIIRSVALTISTQKSEFSLIFEFFSFQCQALSDMSEFFVCRSIWSNIRLNMSTSALESNGVIFFWSWTWSLSKPNYESSQHVCVALQASIGSIRTFVENRVLSRKRAFWLRLLLR